MLVYIQFTNAEFNLSVGCFGHSPKYHQMCANAISRAAFWTDLRETSMRVFFRYKKMRKHNNMATTKTCSFSGQHTFEKPQGASPKLKSKSLTLTCSNIIQLNSIAHDHM